jgi:hypothetical protein
MQKIHDSEQPERKRSCRAALKKICRATKESFGLLLKKLSAQPDKLWSRPWISL